MKISVFQIGHYPKTVPELSFYSRISRLSIFTNFQSCRMTFDICGGIKRSTAESARCRGHDSGISLVVRLQRALEHAFCPWRFRFQPPFQTRRRRRNVSKHCVIVSLNRYRLGFVTALLKIAASTLTAAVSSYLIHFNKPVMNIKNSKHNWHHF